MGSDMFSDGILGHRLKLGYPDQPQPPQHYHHFRLRS